MTNLRDLLQQIKNGKKTFAPASDSPTDMEPFQDVAKTLAFANDKGFLEGFAAHKEHRTGNRWYTEVMVKNGLSHQGLEFLEQPTKPQPRASISDDIVKVQPNLYGIGINFNALWRRLRRKPNNSSKRTR